MGGSKEAYLKRFLTFSCLTFAGACVVSSSGTFEEVKNHFITITTTITTITITITITVTITTTITITITTMMSCSLQ